MVWDYFLSEVWWSLWYIGVGVKGKGGFFKYLENYLIEEIKFMLPIELGQ